MPVDVQYRERVFERNPLIEVATEPPPTRKRPPIDWMLGYTHVLSTASLLRPNIRAGGNRRHPRMP